MQGIPAQGLHAQQMPGLTTIGFMQADVNVASSSGTGMGLPSLSPVGCMPTLHPIKPEFHIACCYMLNGP